MQVRSMIFIEKLLSHPYSKYNLKLRYTIVAKVIENPLSTPELWVYENGIKQEPTSIIRVDRPLSSSNGVRYLNNERWFRNILYILRRKFGSGNYKIKDFSGKGKAVGNTRMVLFKDYLN